MAATVVVYVNRNLETADAVAATASRHPAMRALDPQAAAEVLLPLLGGRDQLLHNALIADTNGRPVAWATPPDAKVEGRLDPAFLKSVATTGKTLISPMLGKAGDDVHAIVLGYPIVNDNHVVGSLGLSVHLEALERVLASIPLPPGSVVTLTDENSVVVARSLEASQYVGRSAAPGGRARNPFEVPASAILTGVDGIERVFGNGVVERGPVAGERRHSDRRWRCRAPGRSTSAISASPSRATLVIIALTWIFGRRWLNAFDHLDETAQRVSRGDLSPLQRQPMPTAEMDRLQATVEQHDHQPAAGARIDRRAGERRAPDARGTAVAAAAGHPAGAPRRDRRARIGRGA